MDKTWRAELWLVGIVFVGCQGRPLAITPEAPSQGAAPAQAISAALTVGGSCLRPRPGRGWTTKTLAQQTGVFAFDFNVTPAGAGTDAVVGLLSGTADAYTDLAAIVRFAPSGVIDVRNGASYTADAYLPYAADLDYHVHMAVDVPRHIYSVWVAPPGQAPTLLASGYAFRTEQAAVTALDGYAAFLDPAASGGLDLCGALMAPPDAAPVAGCSTSTRGGPFVTRPLPRQNGAFVVELNARPSASPTDAVVGLASGPATAYTSLATAVRFADTGRIDVRRGGTYAADASLPYAAGQTYHVKMAVNLTNHTYSVWVAARGGQPVQLALNYPFRTEQAQVMALDGYAQYVDPAATGTLDVCGAIVSGDPACNEISAGGGWLNRALDARSGPFLLELTADTSINQIDGVLGLAAGAATGYDSLAANARFNLSGHVDARNGPAYASVEDLPYARRDLGYSFRFLFDVDLTHHVYSMWAAPVGAWQPRVIARDFAFRPSQAGVSSLDDLGVFVDGSAGALRVCRALSERTGQPLYTALADGYQHLSILPGQPLLVSRPGQSLLVDPATGQVMGRLAVGGVATLGSGGVIIADRFQGAGIGDGVTTQLARFDRQGNLQVPPRPLATEATVVKWIFGTVVVLDGAGVHTYVEGDLSPLQSWDLHASDVAVGPTQNILAAVGNNDPTSAWVARLGFEGTVLWKKTFTSSQDLRADKVTVADREGNIVVAGLFRGQTDLGCGPLVWTSDETGPVGYVAKFDPDGQCLSSKLVVDIQHHVSALVSDGIGDVVFGGLAGGTMALELGTVFTAHGTGWWKDGQDTGLEGPYGFAFIRDLVMDQAGRSYVLIEPLLEEGFQPHLLVYAP
jgi:hypothetical protein